MKIYLKRRNRIVLALCAILLTTCAVLPLAKRVTAAQQSPVDIRSDEALFTPLPPLQFAYGGSVALDVTNNGSPDEFATVRANVPAGGGAVTVDGITYNLLQFHFHTPAEHEINGHRAQMELHFVHQAADGTLLVIGQIIEAGAPNTTLAPLFLQLPQHPGDHIGIAAFNLAALVPADLHSFRYPGSLTTPPFSEGVRWNVVAPTLFLSQAQIDAFKAIFPDGNSREVQALDGRVFVTDVPGFAGLPAPTSPKIVNLYYVGQQPAAGGKAFVSYRADLVNPGGALSGVLATAATLDPFHIRFPANPLSGTVDPLFFVPVGANTLATSQNTVTILTDPLVPLDYSHIDWSFDTVAAFPVANAGPNQTVPVGTAVTLDGRGSQNPSGAGTLTYSWLFTSRPPGTKTVLQYQTTSTASFAADVAGVYVLRLTVSNGTLTNSRNVTVTAF